MTPQTMLPTRCVIIDDEPASRHILKTHISGLPWLTLTHSCENAVQGLHCIRQHKPDIVFLDINMPELSGLELLEMIPSIGSSVIITSAHTKYAIDGYNYEILAFLPKPVSYKSFLKAVNRAIGRQRATIAGYALPPDPGLILSNGEYPIHTPYFDQSVLWVKFDRRLFSIPYQDICFIEGQHNYVAIYRMGDMMVRTRSTISEISRGLPHYFVRTHRSYIVNRHHVSGIDGNTIQMRNNYKVSIAKDERTEIILRLTTGRVGGG